MKRVTMGGTDAVVTDDTVADLILEYAKELGRTGTTDTVAVPAAVGGEAVEASMLLGPASQITLIALTSELDSVNTTVELANLDATCTDLRQRIDRLTSRPVITESDPVTTDALSDFDQLDL